MKILSVTQFKGIRNDIGKKYIDSDYFYNSINFNYDNINGADKILFPDVIVNNSGTDTCYGLFEYEYLNDSNVLKKDSLCIIGSNIYKGFHNNNLVLLKSEIKEGIFTAKVYRDKIVLSNGKNKPFVYNGKAIYEFGSIYAENKPESGNLNGEYYYAITYTTSSGEEVVGTISNTITLLNSKATLTLPIGWTGVTARKIYRTIDSGNSLFLVATVSDNTTLTYEDNIADGSLTTAIPATNNPIPSVYFIEVDHNKIIGIKSDLYPTQATISEDNLEVWDFSGGSIDVSDQSGDNTQIQGSAKDYNKIIIGSEEEIYLLDVSDSTPVLTTTSASIGIKSGYSISKIPSNGDFSGGIFFISSLNDIRLFNGNIAQPIATSIDNLVTENWSQKIQNTIINDIKNAKTIHSCFFNYKYHLLLDQKIYIFDIRTYSWTTYEIKTDSYNPTYSFFGVFDNELYAGQKNNSIIEKFYINSEYRSEDVNAILETPDINFKNKFVFIEKLIIRYRTLDINKWTVDIKLDGNESKKATISADFNSGAYYNSDFYYEDFSSADCLEDYREININEWARFFSFKISSPSVKFGFKGYDLQYRETF